MTSEEYAWAAGFFEGEGCVRINKVTKRNLGTLLVSVSNTDKALVEWFHSRWHGYMKRATGLDLTRQRPAWVWVIAARRAQRFLILIRPFIKSARQAERIDFALEFQSQKRPSTGGASLEYIEEQFNAYLWMAELNLRGAGAHTHATGEAQS